MYCDLFLNMIFGIFGYMRELIEIWRPVVGYEGFYEVSNLGRVRSLDRYKKGKHNAVMLLQGKLLTLKKRSNGYIEISLSKNGKHKSHLLHRLVAEAFIPNPEDKPCVDHINTDRSDNVVWLNQDGSVNYDKTNLRWVTPKENQNNPLSIKKQINNPQRSKLVLQIDSNDKIVNIFQSASEIERNMGKRTSVSSCCRGERKQAYGYMWRYLNDQLADWLEEIQDEDMANEKVA